MQRWIACPVLALLAVVAAATPLDREQARLAERHYKNGVAFMKTESWEEAAQEFRAALSLDPNMAMAHYNLGQCRMAQKRYVEAAGAYTQCRESFERLGALSQEERDTRERARRDEIHELKNDLTRLHTLKGVNVEQYAMRLEERIRLLESMQFRDTERIRIPAEVPLALGSAYFRQERLEDAEREYKEALRLNKKLGPAHNNLAVIYMLTGRLDAAESAARLAEKCGFRVDPRFKKDLVRAKASHKH